VARPALNLAGDDEADALLSEDPLALLIGMVLDQQIPLEKAFRGPAELVARTGRPLSAEEIAAMDPERLAELFTRPPALHRFPGSMARRVQALCQTIVEGYGGRADAVWDDVVDAKELKNRLKALPGFGDQKARIFIALLGKQLGVRPSGWQQMASPFGDPGSHRSVADIVDEPSLAQVRATKKAMKAGPSPSG